MKSQIDWIPDRVVDVVEEPFKFTLLTRGISDYLVDRYSERKEQAPQDWDCIVGSMKAAE